VYHIRWIELKQVAQFNDANQIEKKNDTDYQYDADGNLLQDEHFKYTYNEAQRLTNVQTLEGNTVASYTYDENGLRLTKTVGDTTYEYFYNNEVLDMEVVKKNGEVTQYRSYEWNDYTPNWTDRKRKRGIRKLPNQNVPIHHQPTR